MAIVPINQQAVNPFGANGDFSCRSVRPQDSPAGLQEEQQPVIPINEDNDYRSSSAETEEKNQMVRLRNTRFEFTVHEETEKVMVKVIDEDTNETIREIPPEQILDMVAKMWELAGILLDKRV